MFKCNVPLSKFDRQIVPRPRIFCRRSVTVSAAVRETLCRMKRQWNCGLRNVKRQQQQNASDDNCDWTADAHRNTMFAWTSNRRSVITEDRRLHACATPTGVGKLGRSKVGLGKLGFGEVGRWGGKLGRSTTSKSVW